MNIVLVGIAGYGDFYLTMLEQYVPGGMTMLCGVVDPCAATAPKYAWLKERGIPVYDTLEDFYTHHTAELAILASPTHCHRQQALTAFAHGTHVLCEKPLVPLLEQAAELLAAQKAAGVKLGIGFQWSFCRPIRRLKQDILAGRFGRPLSIKTHLSWVREDSYYTASSWKGRLRGKQGEWILDSVATNAAAHYLHNMFFLLGSSMQSSAMPAELCGSLYRAHEIESFDTCFFKGRFTGGCRFYFFATHAGEVNSNPQFTIEFEEGVAEYNQNVSPLITARMANGTKIVYGDPQLCEEDAQKIILMCEAIRGNLPEPCGIPAVLPHLAVCNAAFSDMPISTFPTDMLVSDAKRGTTYAAGLYESSLQCYEKELLPDELGLAWAAPAVKVQPVAAARFGGIAPKQAKAAYGVR